MAALHNMLNIRSSYTPLFRPSDYNGIATSDDYIFARVNTIEFEFVNDEIISLPTNEAVSLLGDELSYDTFEPIVRYDKITQGSDLRLLPYGSVMRHYHNTNLIGKYYLKKIVRSSATEYELQCISAIGLLDKTKHKGGLYFGETFSEILAEIMQEINVTYSIADDVEDLKIYGWLPYDTARLNLQRLLFATNVHISKDDNDADPVFTYLSIDSGSIADVKVYNDGKEEYPDLATKATISEHSFFFTGLEEETQLFDNSTSGIADHLEVIFSNAPVYVDSVRQEGNIVFEELTTNYMVISGSGIVYGKLYTHNEFNVIRKAVTGGEENEVSVTDDCLITVANSENVADRVMNYFSSRVKIESGIVYNGEKCGSKYAFNDSFREYNIGFLTKMKKIASSFIKAECEFITGYEPIQNGNNYSHCDVISSNGYWYKPNGVKQIRFVLIGGGDGGSSGMAGQDAGVGRTGYSGAGYAGRGGAGGKAGTPGNGGKILIHTVDDLPANEFYRVYCSIGQGGVGGTGNPLDQYNWSTEEAVPGSPGGATKINLTQIGEDLPDITSDDGDYLNGGFADVLNGNIYGMIGDQGFDGGDGGDSGSNSNGENSEEDRLGKSGTDIEFNGVIYHGGAGGNGSAVTWLDTTHTEGIGGGGGAGASYGYDNANNGADASYSLHTYSINMDDGRRDEIYDIYPGNGGDAVRPVTPPTPTIYGKGGAAGHGGAGGGAGGDAQEWQDKGSNWSPEYEYDPDVDDDIEYWVGYEWDYHAILHSATDGKGSPGGVGGNGANGCVLIYY